MNQCIKFFDEYDAIKAKESGVKHFVFMNTVKVYGEETELLSWNRDF